jgi:hypothetical protein
MRPRQLVFSLLSLLINVHADLCAPHAGTDYVCCDIGNTKGVASPAACCDLCNATAGCTAWKFDTNDPAKTCYLKAGALTSPVSCPSCVVGFQAPPPPPPPPPPPHPRTPVFSCAAPTLPAIASLVVYNDTSYEASVGGALWLSGGDVILRLGGKYYSAASGSLAAQSMGPPASGADGLGAFTAFPVSFAAVGAPAAGARVDALFACYASGLVAFNLSLGAQATVTGPVTQGLLTHFPSFVSAGIVGEELGWLLNAGIWTLFEIWGRGTNNGYNGGDGPAWFFNTSFAPSPLAPAGSPAKTATAIVCAIAHFKSMLVGVYDDPVFAQRRLSWGLAGSVAASPAGFQTSVGLFAGTGISETTYAWGRIMTAAYATRRLPLSRDVLNGKLSFWTDNGAVYFQSYWDDVCKRNCTPGVNDADTLFAALKAHHVEQRLPYAIYRKLRESSTTGPPTLL